MLVDLEGSHRASLDIPLTQLLCARELWSYHDYHNDHFHNLFMIIIIIKIMIMLMLMLMITIIWPWICVWRIRVRTWNGRSVENWKESLVPGGAFALDCFVALESWFLVDYHYHHSGWYICFYLLCYKWWWKFSLLSPAANIIISMGINWS